jgi:hypothetical protein
MVFCCVTLGKKTFLQTLKFEGKHAKCHAKKVCQLLAYSGFYTKLRSKREFSELTAENAEEDTSVRGFPPLKKVSVTQRGKRESYLYECNLVLNDETPYLRSCKSCNSEEAKPPNPRYQVEPGNQILEPLALVGCKI